MSSGCCGHPVRRRRPRPARPDLPPNPTVRGGTRLLYIGVGDVSITGASALTYHFSEHRRHVTVRPEDERSLLLRRDIILAP